MNKRGYKKRGLNERRVLRNIEAYRKHPEKYCGVCFEPQGTCKHTKEKKFKKVRP